MKLPTCVRPALGVWLPWRTRFWMYPPIPPCSVRYDTGSNVILISYNMYVPLCAVLYVSIVAFFFLVHVCLCYNIYYIPLGFHGVSRSQRPGAFFPAPYVAVVIVAPVVIEATRSLPNRSDLPKWNINSTVQCDTAEMALRWTRPALRFSLFLFFVVGTHFFVVYFVEKRDFVAGRSVRHVTNRYQIYTRKWYTYSEL